MNQKIGHITLFAFIILLVSSCAPQEQVEIPEHIRELKNVNIYPLPENPDTVLLQREQTFGSTEDKVVGNIIAARVDRSGRVYIGDSDQLTIHVFNPDGSYHTGIGRKGQGPGEFNAMLSFHMAGQYLYIADNKLQRITAITTDPPEFSHVFRIDPTTQPDIEGVKVLLPYLASVRNDSTYLMRFTRMGAADETYWAWYYLINKEGRIISDQIIKERQPYPRIPIAPNLVRRQMISHTASHNIISISPEDFLIKVYDPEGTYQHAIHYRYPRVPVNKDAITERAEEPREREILRKTEIPEYWPAFNELYVDDQDRIWVSTNLDGSNLRQWWVLNLQGELLARFRWETDRHGSMSGRDIQQIADGHIYTLEDGETGEEVVVRYQISIN